MNLDTGSVDTGAVQTEGQTQEQNQAQGLDLDAHKEFSFQGEKYTPEALKELLEEYKFLKDGHDSFAKDREYHLNLKHDLARVKANPQLAAEFRKIYPAQFHDYVDFVLAGGSASEAAQSAESQSQNKQSPQLPKEVLDRLSKIDEFEARVKNADQQAASAQLDRIIEKFSSKYPLAKEKLVLAEVSEMIERGYKMTDSAWERVFKSVHEDIEKTTSEYQKAQLNKQQNKGKQATDMGPGGSAPGSAPQSAKTMKEAEAEFLRFLQTGR